MHSRYQALAWCLLVAALFPAQAGALPFFQAVELSRATEFRARTAEAPDGSVWCSWHGFEDQAFDIYVSRWNGSVWAPPDVITNDPGADHQADIAVGPSGDVWVAWVSNRNGNDDIYAKCWSGSSWGPDIPVDTDAARDLYPTLIHDGTTFRLFWYSSRNSDMDIFTSRWSGSAWSAPVLVVGASGDDRYPEPALDANGTLWITWMGSAHGNLEVYACRELLSSWSAPERITDDPANDGRSVLGLDRDGKLWALWDSARSGFYDIYGAYRSGGVWSAPVQISSATFQEFAPRVARDATGQLWTVFYGLEGFGTQEWEDDNSELFVSQCMGTTWSAPVRVTETFAYDYTPDLALDGNDLLLITCDSTQYGWENSDIMYLLADPNSILTTGKAMASAVPSLPRTNHTLPRPPAGVAQHQLPNGAVEYAPRPRSAQPASQAKAPRDLILAAVDVDAGFRTIAAGARDHEIKLFDANGAPLFSFGAQGSGAGQFQSPYGVCVDDSGRILVADTGNHRVQIFDASGNFISTFGSRGSGDGQFLHPRGIDARGGFIAVADSGNHRVQVFTSAGVFQFAFGQHGIHDGELNEPWDVAILSDGSFAVANTWSYRVALFDENGEFIEDDGRNLYGPSGVAADDEDRLYLVCLPGANIVERDPAAVCSRNLTSGGGAGFGSMFGAAWDPRGKVVFTREGADTPWAVPIASPDPVSEPRITSLSSTGFTLSWNTGIPCRTRVEYGAYPDYGQSYYDGQFKTVHDVTLTGLQPGTRYRLRYGYQNPFNQSVHYVEDINITTPDDLEHTLDIQQLPTCVLVYRNFQFQGSPQIDPIILSDQDVANIDSDTASTFGWYYHNSLYRLHFPLTLVEVDTFQTLADGDFSRSFCYTPIDLLTPWPHKVEQDLPALGITPEMYDNFVTFFGFRCYAEYPTGIFSWGCAVNLLGGRGFCAIPNCWPDNNKWYTLHEGHHSLDGMLAASGFGTYWHADLLWENPEGPGNDRDANAWMLRNWPADQWFGFRAPFGHPVRVADSDRDGVPDNSAELPNDEARLGGNNTTSDTDDDGLEDLNEATAGLYGGTDLTDEDSDGDTFTDGSDPAPMYPVGMEIYRGTPEIDGVLEDTWQPFSTGFVAMKTVPEYPPPNVYVLWDDNAIYLAFEFDMNTTLQLKVDANSDGWYHGHDNYEVEIHPRHGTRTFHVSDCSPELICELGYCQVDDADNYPFAPLVSPGELMTASQTVGDHHVMEVSIARNAQTGLVPAHGKTVGLQIKFGNIEGYWDNWATVFELDTLHRVTMVEPQPVPATGALGLLLAVTLISRILLRRKS